MCFKVPKLCPGFVPPLTYFPLVFLLLEDVVKWLKLCPVFAPSLVEEVFEVPTTP